ERVLNAGVEGLGLGTTAQLVPFHCSIRVPLPLSPTAHTSLADTAATPLSPAPGPTPLGLATMLQAVPFQCSVRVWNTVPAPLVVWKSPAAQTSFAEMAVTPASRVFCALALGVVTTDQLRPVQCSVGGCAPPVGGRQLPPPPTV